MTSLVDMSDAFLLAVFVELRMIGAFESIENLGLTNKRLADIHACNVRYHTWSFRDAILSRLKECEKRPIVSESARVLSVYIYLKSKKLLESGKKSEYDKACARIIEKAANVEQIHVDLGKPRSSSKVLSTTLKACKNKHSLKEVVLREVIDEESLTIACDLLECWSSAAIKSLIFRVRNVRMFDVDASKLALSRLFKHLPTMSHLRTLAICMDKLAGTAEQVITHIPPRSLDHVRDLLLEGFSQTGTTLTIVIALLKACSNVTSLDIPIFLMRYLCIKDTMDVRPPNLKQLRLSTSCMCSFEDFGVLHPCEEDDSDDSFITSAIVSSLLATHGVIVTSPIDAFFVVGGDEAGAIDKLIRMDDKKQLNIKTIFYHSCYECGLHESEFAKLSALGTAYDIAILPYDG